MPSVNKVLVSLLQLAVIAFARECVLDSDCEQSQQFGRIQAIQLCYSNKCVPSPHPCKPTPCGQWASCAPARRTGRAICFCPPGFHSDAPLFGCRPNPLNPCEPSPCGPHSTCEPLPNQRLTCGCQHGFVPAKDGAAGCMRGCQGDDECAPGLMCRDFECLPRPCKPSPCGCGGCTGSASPWSTGGQITDNLLEEEISSEEKLEDKMSDNEQKDDLIENQEELLSKQKQNSDEEMRDVDAKDRKKASEPQMGMESGAVKQNLGDHEDEERAV